jgi:hypothetical protein
LLLFILAFDFGLEIKALFTSGFIVLQEALFSIFKVPLFTNQACAICFAKNTDGSALNANQSVNHTGLFQAILSCHPPIHSKSL